MLPHISFSIMFDTFWLTFAVDLRDKCYWIPWVDMEEEEWGKTHWFHFLLFYIEYTEIYD